MPTTLPPGMVIAAMLKRANPYDALVLSRKQQNRDLVNPASTSSSPSTLSGLQKGSVVGTSSVRRIAQIRRRFPHLVFLDVVKREGIERDG